ncbi:SDR family NAD(P)-dependent oxidoreductase [Nitratireductor luteus]|uniref:SDR family NAD(P)-dependent oxidoreductase n=1 Tax=Nitratireductor luteus TaxID=2976980 RepID=UPI00224012F7|nr:SDR family NAD(P)-dependent oxidoreductase [Nitratireductor luteus]
MLYRAGPDDGIAWITGAGSGIGRELALDLAGRGYHVAATARSNDALERLAEEARPLPGRITAVACDVTDVTAMERMVDHIETALGPIALAVFNAGQYLPTRGEYLDSGKIREVLETNLLGVANGIVPVSHRMRSRGFGHIAIMGSLTTHIGLPSAAAYGASKAALNNLSECLRFDFERLNIRIQIVNPGFVDTPLTARHPFPRPALIDAHRAAARFSSALRTGGFATAFPRRLAWSVAALNLLPQEWRFAILMRLTGWRQRKRPSPHIRANRLATPAGGVVPLAEIRPDAHRAQTDR